MNTTLELYGSFASVTYSDERLRKVAEPVKEVNAEIQRIVDDMFDTMYAEEGIGLAATRVDIHQRIIVIDVSENREEQLVLTRNAGERWRNRY
ncbi:peptide deformylase [Klebsiella pneumoniae]|uniref:Peptide deformylase n=1 Tax=Klebsiella pneumoniae TaxID=573 RepID=A0A939NS11_KLEPN|nr:peptide deformylase [Klebsiella pneumoniae]